MKTDLLIDMLARGAGPAPKILAWQRFAPAMLIGLISSTLLSQIIIGPFSLPASFFVTAAPWIKLGYAFSLTCAATWLSLRLSRPVAHLKSPTTSVLIVFVVMMIFGLLVFLQTQSDQRITAVLGHTSIVCPWIIALISLPTLGTTLWAMRGLAPTQLRRAGAAAGLLSGAIGVMGYALACNETSPTFIAIWYSFGIGLTTLLGTLLGPKVLRW